MSNLSWLTLKGSQQGLISENCGSRYSIGNKSQVNHIDQIMVYGLQHETSRESNVCHHALQMIKPVDRASPLLNKAINDNEELEAGFGLNIEINYLDNELGISDFIKKTLERDVPLSNKQRKHGQLRD